MNDGRPLFRTARPPWNAGLAPLAIAMVVVGAVWVARTWAFMPGEPPGALVEVRGDVPKPGWHRVDPPTMEEALRAAGVERRVSAAAVHDGDRLTVTDEGGTHHPRGNPLLIGLPVDVNDASAEALEAVPGIGPSMAAAIVAERDAGGPFYTVAELDRVPGLGPKKVTDLAPLLTVGDVGPRPSPAPLDVNRATAAELERLPGIGATLAARIVVDRDERGPYRTLDDLRRVRGVTAGIVTRLRGHAEAR